MKNELPLIRELHTAYEVQDRPNGFAKGLVSLAELPEEVLVRREKFITEELTETIELGFRKRDHIEILDGICDSIVVNAGTVNELGLDIIPEFNPACIYLLEQMLGAIQKQFADKDANELTKMLMAEYIVLRGICAVMGYPYKEAFAEVHRSNMSKFDDEGKPVRNADNKVIKGPNYSPPDMLRILEEAGFRPENADV